LKHNLKDFPLYHIPIHEGEIEEIRKWLEGFEKELREIKDHAKNEPDYRWKKFNAGLIWSIEEILGE